MLKTSQQVQTFTGGVVVVVGVVAVAVAVAVAVVIAVVVVVVAAAVMLVRVVGSGMSQPTWGTPVPFLQV